MIKIHQVNSYVAKIPPIDYWLENVLLVYMHTKILLYAATLHHVNGFCNVYCQGRKPKLQVLHYARPQGNIALQKSIN